MKIFKYSTLVLALLVGFGACTLPDNVNPKRATDVPAETLFINAQIAFVNQVDEVSVNLNISRLITQYWQESIYFTESRYNFQDRGISDGYWDRFYRSTLQDFKETKDVLNSVELTGVLAAERQNKIAIVEVMEIYSYQALVDAFGPVPYTQALGGAENSTPAYDDPQTIYNDLVDRIAAAIGMMDLSNGSWGSSDLIYGGDMASWKKFAASLQMRIGMRLSDVDPGKSKSTVEAGYNNGAFTDQSESAMLHYVGVVPHVNAIYDHFVVDNRKDYLPSNTLIDLLNDRNDPRIDNWFTQVDDGAGNMIYLGAVIGLDGAQSFNNFSNFTEQFVDPTLEAMLMDRVEVEFLLAEAVERGYNVGGTAAEHYNNGITQSILYWGGTQEDADTYLANPDVAYTTAAGDFKQKIGEQKWIALYNRGVESWAEWRRLDYPIFNVPEGMTYQDIPRRYPFPFDEGELNGEMYDAAVSAIGGVDDHRSRIFWDVQ